MLTASKCASNRGQSGARKSRDAESSRESSPDIIRRGGVKGKERNREEGQRSGGHTALEGFSASSTLKSPHLTLTNNLQAS